jgi:hypothetical protein
MNRTLFRIFIAVMALHLGMSGVQAQISVQRLTFSLVGQYQTNIVVTTAPSSTNWTELHPIIRPILITTENVIKAMAVDISGTNFRDWTGGSLIREVDLGTGEEGIFLRKGPNLTNVSSYFGATYLSNFTAGIANGFPGYTNNISDQPTTNLITGSEGPIPQTTVYRGYLYSNAPDTIETNYLKTTALHYISFNTANVKFNLVAVGQGNATNITGTVGATHYKTAITWENSGCAGTFYLNITTNIYTNGGTNVPARFITGPMQGSFHTQEPAFSPKAFGAPF